MRGYQVTFFTQQDHKHRGQPLGEWLLTAAQRLGVAGATLVAANEGFGHHRKIHSARFFELADQPIEVTMALSQEEIEQIFNLIKQEKINVFYVKTPIEFGMTGEL